MKLLLERFSYAKTETEGVITFPAGQELATIEKPWEDNVPFESCIPEGTYILEPYTRGSGTKVVRLVNEGLGVYRTQAEMGDNEGRYAILIHSGNWSTDVVGCIAPGMKRYPMRNPKTKNMEQAVSRSRDAMITLMAMLPDDEENIIEIVHRQIL